MLSCKVTKNFFMWYISLLCLANRKKKSYTPWNNMHLEVFLSWLDTEISFKDPKSMSPKSLKINQQQTFKGQVLLLCLYSINPSLPCKWCSIVQFKNWIGLIVCRFLSINLSKSYSNSASEYLQIHEILPTMRILYFCWKSIDETDLLAPVEVDSHVYPHITYTYYINYPN